MVNCCILDVLLPIEQMPGNKSPRWKWKSTRFNMTMDVRSRPRWTSLGLFSHVIVWLHDLISSTRWQQFGAFLGFNDVSCFFRSVCSSGGNNRRWIIEAEVKIMKIGFCRDVLPSLPHKPSSGSSSVNSGMHVRCSISFWVWPHKMYSLTLVRV